MGISPRRGRRIGNPKRTPQIHLQYTSIGRFSQDCPEIFPRRCMRLIAPGVYTVHETAVHPHFPHGYPQIWAAKPLSHRVLHIYAPSARSFVTSFPQTRVCFCRTNTKSGRFYDIPVRVAAAFLSILRGFHRLLWTTTALFHSRRLHFYWYMFQMYCKRKYSEYTTTARIKPPACEYRPAFEHLWKVTRTSESTAAH